MSRPIRRDLLIGVTVFVFVPTAAHAYVDPGSAGFIITSVLGALAAIGYFVRAYWRRLNTACSIQAGRRSGRRRV